MNFKIPLFKTYSDEKDVEAVSKIIRRGSYWAIGPEIEEFEKKIASFIGKKYALTFNSGTSALLTLLLAYDIRDKEVIVPSFTFVATANVVLLAGGIPIFAESESETFGLDAEDVKKRITKNTKMIIPLHYGGFPSRDTEKLRKIAEENKVLLVDDAAESFGSMINGKKIGNFCDSAMFSLCQNKVISTGEGGMIVTDSEEIFEKAKLIRSHGRVELSEDYFSSTKDNDYIVPGYNFRMPTMLAALGISQIEKIDKIIDMRRKKAAYFDSLLSKIGGIIIPKEQKGNFSVYQMYTIKLKNPSKRDLLQKFLADKGIMSKVYFNPVHLKTIYIKEYGYKEGDLPKTEEISRCVLNIPFYPQITEQEIDYISDSIKEFFKNENSK